MRRVSCGPASMLGEGMLVKVPILPSFTLQDDEIGQVKVKSVLLARVGGVIYAYANMCRHIPLGLDLGDGEIGTADGRQFLCHHHGARYRIEDGFCTYGPCEGDSLRPVAFVIDEGELTLHIDEFNHLTP